jgi:hypothetical protein
MTFTFVGVLFCLSPGHDLGAINWSIAEHERVQIGGSLLRGGAPPLPYTDPGESFVEGISDYHGPASDPTYSERVEKWKGGTIHYPTMIHFPPHKQQGRTTDMTYPDYKDLNEIVKAWNPDNPDPPAEFTETLQHFNYSDPRERAMAATFRDAELPFKIYNVPEFEHVRCKWDRDYLNAQLGRLNTVHIERSDTNHFMYWNGKKKENFEPPTDMLRNGEMLWDEWLAVAEKADREKPSNQVNMTHYYFMHSALKGDTEGTFVARDLPLFSSGKKNFFIVNPKLNKGIQCRFGMRGIIAEAHYDGGRNNVVMLKGTKRYILTPPTECDHLDLINDRTHPSYRHSLVDWSDPEQAKERLSSAKGIDTIVREGEMLYIPSYWIHYIISMEYSIQCNSRSGPPPDKAGLSDIERCMGRGNVTPQSLVSGGGIFEGGGGKEDKRARKRRKRKEKEKAEGAWQ